MRRLLLTGLTLLAVAVLMAGPTNAEEAAILDGMFNDPAYTPPATRYLAMSTTTPLEDGSNFTEPSGNGYARIATTAADWDAASGGAPSTKANGAALSFAQASGSWGTGTHMGVFDALATGTVKNWGALSASKAVGTGDTASFAIGQLIFKLGDPADSY